MVTAYIGLGSNLGNCRQNLQRAWNMLGEVRSVNLQALSNPYLSAPVNMESTHWFINAVGSLRTSLQPGELLAEMLAVETRLGRRRGLPGEPEDRTVDLDLLYWDGMVSHGPELILPHPEIARRLFVLLPLAEIGPEMIHPVLRKSSLEMLQELMAIQPENIPGAQVRKTSWSSAGSEVSE